MAVITIRNIDDSLKQRLRLRAAQTKPLKSLRG